MSELSNLFSLKGKTVLVTGAAGLQGQRVTRGLAAHGADIAPFVLHARLDCALARFESGGL